MSPLVLASIAVFAPLVVALLLMVIRPLRHTGVPAAALSVVGALASLAASVALMVSQLEPGHNLVLEETWLVAGGRTIATVGFYIDGISTSMLVVVALVATCVQVFSLEYMNDEDNAGYGRYFTYQSLFLFSMQALVLAPNMLQLFAAWELVGLCSYLLIGFYYTKPSAARAALKAFWITKFADMGLLLGLILQYVAVHDVVGNGVHIFGWTQQPVDALVASGAVSVVAGLYFLAVMGKSAQFPLHVWLPDAMEGPTPVSALLHAATMVAAGVYLIVRAFPIFQAAPSVMLAMSLIGGFTAFFAACIAFVQTDIKKVLAFSTCSQLGYMIAALGGGSLMGGYFHLTTHAMFKALLFLAAGSVIHAVHSNEMSDMGGLWQRMKLTSTVFIIGTLALAGLPFLSGFYSKDLILEALLHTAQHDGGLAWLPFVFCMAAAGMTAFYMGRVLMLTFFGELSEKASHAHEHGIAMSLPLVVLAIAAIGAGWAGGTFGHMWGVHDYHFAFAHFTPVGIAATLSGLIGLGLAYAIFGMGLAGALRMSLLPVSEFIEYGAVDRGLRWVYVSAMAGFAEGLGWFDRYVIDGLMNMVGAGSVWAGDRIRAVQTGNVSDYLYVVLASAVALAAWSQIFWAQGAGA